MADALIFDSATLQKLYKAVDALPKEATETAKKEITRKGYDTTGYQYQFLVNVLNEVLGPCHWSYDYQVLQHKTVSTKTGLSMDELTVEVTVTILGVARKNIGGHASMNYADALKGAITNGLKKTLGMFGIGKKAYEGTLDEDYRQGEERGKKSVKTVTLTNPTETCPKCNAPMRVSQKSGTLYCSKLCWKTKTISVDNDIPTIEY